ncbi:3-deoxy-7-phosphoheptulonate synthase [Acidobacteria bacterium AH-259-G07]|nr:3-deoxy-7-phosphoheptulonate synthase [Acidobacteria bacterium AH-259-G07]
MVIVMQAGASPQQIQRVMERIKSLGYEPHPMYGVERTVIGAIGDERGKSILESLISLQGVESVIPILKPFKLASREIRPEATIVQIAGIQVGKGGFALIAGPCSVESETQIIKAAAQVKEAGANMLRGGAFKPRTSPYSFQGLEHEGLKLLAKARQETGLAVVTEVLSPEDVGLVAEYADVLQVGARNMQNFPLLKKLGKVNRPILLKRGMMCTVKETLMCAEYILSSGNPSVILCERGIRTFEDATRNTLDLAAVSLLKEWSHLPVIVDPTHGTGVKSLILPMSKAAIAAGADGLMVEVHPKPEEALSDGFQALLPEEFKEIVKSIGPYLKLEGKEVHRPTAASG